MNIEEPEKLKIEKIQIYSNNHLIDKWYENSVNEETEKKN